MYKELIINSTTYETRVALLENGVLVELFVERTDSANIEGNIYKGRVQRVLPGMQAAFVEIGMNQSSFIYVDDVIADPFKEIEEMFPITDDDFEEKSKENKNNHSKSDTPIEDLIKEGQDILVQAAKSPIGSKGARVTSHISLPGRFLVLMPTVDHIGISKKIDDEAERNRLKDIVLSTRNEPYGYIVRTAGEDCEKEKIENEMIFLVNLWGRIKNKYKTAPSSSLLHNELTVTLKAVRDLLTHEADKVIVDTESAYNTVLSFLEEFMPGLKGSVEFYSGTEPIFDAYNLEGDISRALQKKVWLKSGGYIVIEPTEALVAIDVNTGRYVGKHNFEETISKTNLEAVKEIAFQIRLRNLGGIIIIDFIDMENKSNKEKVYNALLEALEKDRSKTNVLPMSEIGLMQMTRKRTRNELTKIVCEPCFYCDGDGYLVSKQSICYNIYREILRQAQDMVKERLTLRVNPEIAELLLGEENIITTVLEEKLGKQIIIYPDSRFHLQEFDIIEDS